MERFAGLTNERLNEIVGQFARVRIAVLGDFFLDKYLGVDPALAERSVETGKTAHQVVRVRHSPGAAGTVVANLAALGAGTLWTIGYAGDDGEGYELRQGLAAAGCRLGHLHVAPDRKTPTYLKPRDVNVPGLEGEHPRYDTKNRTPTPQPLEQAVLGSLDSLLPELDAVVIADQVEEAECGVVTTPVRNALTERAAAHPRIIFLADSRRRIGQFRGVLVKPNQFEAAGREFPRPGEEVPLDALVEAIPGLRKRVGTPVLVTLGSRGMLVSDPVPTHVPGVPVDGPTDPTGAGDSATAGTVLSLAAGATLPEACLVGNLVASITIEQLGTTGTARPEQLRPRLERWRGG
ncbi:MAG: PfkB family carbohydrate kinase [Thermoguttaceae bacterium]|jgi:bifunctional ADP-heptose synthase (sugar kinase/adenylyltransferase)|nr:PfkB family carbohydrate kinase [Thermoguttaceae bacterium]